MSNQVVLPLEDLEIHYVKLSNGRLKLDFKEKDKDFPQGFSFEIGKEGAKGLINMLSGYLGTFKFKVVKIVGGGNQEEWYTHNLGEMGTFTTREEAEKWCKEHKDELVYKEGDILTQGASYSERFEIREE
jgi:hypothetical protein